MIDFSIMNYVHVLADITSDIIPVVHDYRQIMYISW